MLFLKSFYPLACLLGDLDLGVEPSVEDLGGDAYLFIIVPYISPLSVDTYEGFLYWSFTHFRYFGFLEFYSSHILTYLKTFSLFFPPPFFLGATVDQVLQQLDEVWVLCAKGRIHLPMVDIRLLRALNPSRFTVRLPEFAGVVARCLELVKAASWSQTELELHWLEGLHMGLSHVVS